MILLCAFICTTSMTAGNCLLATVFVFIFYNLALQYHLYFVHRPMAIAPFCALLGWKKVVFWTLRVCVHCSMKIIIKFGYKCVKCYAGCRSRTSTHATSITTILSMSLTSLKRKNSSLWFVHLLLNSMYPFFCWIAHISVYLVVHCFMQFLRYSFISGMHHYECIAPNIDQSPEWAILSYVDCFVVL